MNDCIKCKSKCCQLDLSFSVLLTKSEIQQLSKLISADENLSKQINASDFFYYDPDSNGYKIKNIGDSHCIFWDSQESSCLIYKNRPLDCRIFPLEYYWFRWILSKSCPRKFDITKLKSQLKEFPPSTIRELKLMHISTPESTQDRLWITLVKYLKLPLIYSVYAKIRNCVERIF